MRPTRLNHFGLFIQIVELLQFVVRIRHVAGELILFGFVAGHAWAPVDLALGDFVPRHRGRTVDGAPPLEAGAIRTLGFLIADRQGGPFRLELASIAART